MRGISSRAALAAVVLTLPAMIASAGAAAAKSTAAVRLVCNGSTYACPSAAHFTTIQAAVDAASPGDWVLVWPGVYHEKGSPGGGVYITKEGIHLRGLDRNLVVIDGSNGTAAQPCPSDPALQDFTGGNGVEVYKANGTYVDNMTVCDYLTTPTGKGGNEVWWNGGDGSGQIGMTTYWGNYLTATSQYAGPNAAAEAQYGIFVSNASGPGWVKQSYAANMSDSAYYVGACQVYCHALLDHVRGLNSALGYSGTNAGNLTIQYSEFALNRAGIVPNSLNNDDAPPPQDGRCPGAATKSCTFIQYNHVHDNNNPNVPGAGIAAVAPVGSGIELSGASYNTLRHNLVENQGAWGIVIHEYPDPETPPASGISHCQGGIQVGPVCDFPALGNVVYANTLRNNGGFGNPTNGDLANAYSATPKNCFFENSFTTSAPPMIEVVDGPPCSGFGPGDPRLMAELVCASGIGNCTIPGANYPQSTGTVMLPVPHEPTMPSPCSGAPANPYCPGGSYLGPHS